MQLKYNDKMECRMRSIFICAPCMTPNLVMEIHYEDL